MESSRSGPVSGLVHGFIFDAAAVAPGAEALVYRDQRLKYADLARQVDAAARFLIDCGISSDERVGVYLEKRIEAVVPLFGAAAAGAVFVPINPLLKPAQVAYILRDCNVRILVTSAERLALLTEALALCPDLHTVIVAGPALVTDDADALPGLDVLSWDELMRHALADASNAGNDTVAVIDIASGDIQKRRRIDSDMAAILYTSGSTGQPKGVVLSHRNLTAGAISVAGYLENTPADRILAALPLSFDYGLSQLTTAFHAGATVVLMNYLLPRDIVTAVRDERITGLAAVPPLWMQLAQQSWPQDNCLRYITNSGGAMQRPTLDRLRGALPTTQVYLMYGLTEAFRSTFLPPAELDRRPDSIGRAIPNVEIAVVRPDGSLCGPDEPGELVHRGPLVALGYWNDAEKSAACFRPAPGRAAALPELPFAELAVWSGDTVRMDRDGFLYFIGRGDDMIKSSGYRISPQEVEQVVYATGLVGEAAAIGVPHPQLGQAVVLVVPRAENVSLPALLAQCRQRLPSYMVPLHVEQWVPGDKNDRDSGLPRTPNGKIDRKLLQQSLAAFFGDEMK